MVDASRYKLKLLGFTDRQMDELSKKTRRMVHCCCPRAAANIFGFMRQLWRRYWFCKSRQTAVITVPTDKSKKIYGKVISLDPILDKETRSIRARISAANPAGLIRHQSYLNVEIQVRWKCFDRACWRGDGYRYPSDCICRWRNGVFNPGKLRLAQKRRLLHGNIRFSRRGERGNWSEFSYWFESQLKAIPWHAGNTW